MAAKSLLEDRKGPKGLLKVLDNITESLKD